MRKRRGVRDGTFCCSGTVWVFLALTPHPAHALADSGAEPTSFWQGPSRRGNRGFAFVSLRRETPQQLQQPGAAGGGQ